MGGPERPGQLAAVDHRRVRAQPAPARHRLHRPLPDPPPRRDRHRRDARRAERPGPRGQGPLLRLLHLPGRADRRGPVGRRAPRPRALPHRAAALLDPRARHRARRAADGQRYGMGVIPLESARRGLAVRDVRRGQGEHLPSIGRCCPTATTFASRQPAQARVVDRAAAGGRRGRALADRTRAGLRARAPGRHLPDHRTAHVWSSSSPSWDRRRRPRRRRARPDRRHRPARPERRRVPTRAGRPPR